jgi:hypothetical protein
LAVNTKPQKSPKRFWIESTPGIGDLDVKSYDKHVNELQTEMRQINVNVGHMKTLLRATFKQGRVWIIPVQKIFPVVRKSQDCSRICFLSLNRQH